jgi:hypothetical protein
LVVALAALLMLLAMQPAQLDAVSAMPQGPSVVVLAALLMLPAMPLAPLDAGLAMQLPVRWTRPAMLLELSVAVSVAL